MTLGGGGHLGIEWIPPGDAEGVHVKDYHWRRSGQHTKKYMAVSRDADMRFKGRRRGRHYFFLDDVCKNNHSFFKVLMENDPHP